MDNNHIVIFFVSTFTQQWGKACYSYAVLYLFLLDIGECECVLALEEKRKIIEGKKIEEKILTVPKRLKFQEISSPHSFPSHLFRERQMLPFSQKVCETNTKQMSDNILLLTP